MGFICLSCSVTSNATTDLTEIKIGVLAPRGIEKTLKKWRPMVNYLDSKVTGYRFTIVPLNNNDIRSKIESDELDLVLTNPASYVSLEITHGITRILTLKYSQTDKTRTKFGAVIIAKANRDDIQSVKDLKGKHFLAVHEKAFGGWWMARGVLEKADINPFKDLKKLEYMQFPQDKIVLAIKNGYADAGTVRTSILERMEKEGKINLNDFKIINQKKYKGFPFLVSTELYPEWPLAITHKINPELADDIAIALLQFSNSQNIQNSGNKLGWTVPLDYQSVHNLMSQLNVGPYASQNDLDIFTVISHYRYVILSVFIIFTILAISLFYISRLNRSLDKTSIGLESEIISRQKIQNELQQQATQFRKLYELLSTPGLTLDEQIKETLKYGCESFGLEVGKVSEINIETQNLTIIHSISTKDFPVHQGQVIPIDKTICSIVYASEHGIASNNLHESEHQNIPSIKATEFSAYIATPIYLNEEKYGTVSFSSRKKRNEPFSETEIDLVNLIGKWISVSMEQEQTKEITVAKETAEAASRAKSTFLSNMSHEIRTPLTAIIGFAEIVHQRIANTDDNKPLLSKTISNAKHLMSIINDILDISKIEADKLLIHHEALSLFDMMDDIKSMFEQKAIAKGLEFKIIYQFPLPESITSDVVRLKQIIINLCSNAEKFTDLGHIHINIYYDIKSEHLSISVEDSGIGLTKSQCANIFTAFTQAEKTTTKNYGGTGLGLTISKQLAEKLDGKLTVKSELGEGSRFILRIHPSHVSNFCHEMPQIIEKEIIPTKSADTHVEGSILLVEDIVDNQELITIYLDEFGADVVIANNGEEAVALCETNKYDLILMDIQMPIMNGFDALCNIRRNDINTPIVMLTANALKEEKLRCLKAGGNDFLLKPIDVKLLEKIVFKYLKNSERVIDCDSLEKNILSTKTISSEDELVSSLFHRNDKFKRIVTRFIQQFPGFIEKLNNAYKENDIDALKTEAHRLKGLGGNMGFLAITDLSKTLEEAITKENTQKIESCLHEFSVLNDRMLLGLNNTIESSPDLKKIN